MLERLKAELGETDDVGRPILFDTVALAGVGGNEDGVRNRGASRTATPPRGISLTEDE